MGFSPSAYKISKEKKRTKNRTPPVQADTEGLEEIHITKGGQACFQEVPETDLIGFQKTKVRRESLPGPAPNQENRRWRWGWKAGCVCIHAQLWTCYELCKGTIKLLNRSLRWSELPMSRHCTQWTKAKRCLQQECSGQKSATRQCGETERTTSQDWTTSQGGVAGNQLKDT